jgi:hypothetical protein
MIKGKNEREELKESPFILHFEYGTGVGKEGCWTHDHMSLCLSPLPRLFKCLYVWPQLWS